MPCKIVGAHPPHTSYYTISVYFRVNRLFDLLPFWVDYFGCTCYACRDLSSFESCLQVNLEFIMSRTRTMYKLLLAIFISFFRFLLGVSIPFKGTQGQVEVYISAAYLKHASFCHGMESCLGLKGPWQPWELNLGL